MNHYTTLRRIDDFDPCERGMTTLRAALGPDYGEDTPITYRQILEANGIEDAIWAIRCDLSHDRDRDARLFACDCADHVLHLCGDDERPAHAIAVARRFALGYAEPDELFASWVYPRDARFSGAYNAAIASCRHDGWDAAWASSWNAAWYESYLRTVGSERLAQTDIFLSRFGE